ncbi:MAG: hypothetical protein R3E50_12920 [Halioglobus sp.]
MRCAQPTTAFLAIIDHQGRILQHTPQFVETVLTGKVEVMLGNTPFSSFGSLPILGGCVVGLLIMGVMYLGFWRDN